ncbi:transposase [Propionibacteriaceae bacterium Y1923]|uniref:transposase n=1 Tax=Aestuariimicrobium sp. Y1814 TaxID=3418742 RepID=UPI003C15325A
MGAGHLDLTAWCQLLALTGHDARRWEPKRLRLRLFAIPAVLVRSARQVRLRIADHNPWAHLLSRATERLTTLPAPT